MNIKLFLSGILLITIPIYRQEFFVRHATIFPLYFILFSLGLVIMLWSLSAGRVKRFAILLGVCVVGEAALVGSVVYFASYQSFTPPNTDYYYWLREQYSYFKNSTNFDSNLSQHDSILGYRFQPTISGRFTNPEFNVEIKTNSLGVRDDEPSLRRPEIVVLGDSHGMGWGVEKQDRFSEVIERKLRTRVLNTAITSYGTHRQTKLLSKVDLDSCKLLIIQYCENDLDENVANLDTPQRPGIDAHGFAVASRGNIINKIYFPFKGLFLATRWLINRSVQFTKRADNSALSTAAPRKSHSDAFFPYIERIRKMYKGPILVFDLGAYNYPVVKEFQTYTNIQAVSNTYFYNVHPLLTHEDYFVIDDHINSNGHSKIGEALSTFIQQNGWLSH